MWENGGINTRVHNPGTMCRLVASFNLRPLLFPGIEAPVPTGPCGSQTLESLEHYFRKLNRDSPGILWNASVITTGLGAENRIQDLQNIRQECYVFSRDVWWLLLKRRRKQSVGYLSTFYQLLRLLSKAYERMIWFGEFERIWEEKVLAYLKVVSRHYSGGSEQEGCRWWSPKRWEILITGSLRHLRRWLVVFENAFSTA
jgi:hypothetical protein